MTGSPVIKAVEDATASENGLRRGQRRFAQRATHAECGIAGVAEFVDVEDFVPVARRTSSVSRFRSASATTAARGTGSRSICLQQCSTDGFAGVSLEDRRAGDEIDVRCRLVGV